MGSISEGTKDLAKAIMTRKQNRETEAVKDAILIKMQEAGAQPDTIELISKIKAESPEKLTSAIKDIQSILGKTPAGSDDLIAMKVKEATEVTKAKEQAKLDPTVVSGQLDVRGQQKQQDLDFKAQEQFLDIQKQILQKGVDLDATEKQRLVFAEQGAKTVKVAQELLNDKNFVGAVFQSAGGTIGKLSTAGNTQLRNYNTAIESSIVSYMFANSGAQASDKERAAFRSIYGAQVGDTLENVKFKNQLVSSFFETAKDIIDPNKVAGLSVAELNAKLKEIKSQLTKAAGKGKEGEIETVLNGIKNKALGEGGNDDTLSKLGLDPSKYELVEE